MDPAGGPGPPRPAAEPATNIAPAPVEGALQMFPFNAAQQQNSLGLQIGQATDSLALPSAASAPFDASEPFATNPFLATMSARPSSHANLTNSAQNASSGTAMLQQVNAAPGTSQLSAMPSGQHRQPAPSHTQQSTSRDFFGELEKALSLGGSAGQNNPEESFDVLDHALAMGSQPVQPQSQQVPVANQIVSSQQQAAALQSWQQAQDTNASIQRTAQLQQSQFQSQLEQQRQQNQVRQRHLRQQAEIAQQHLRQQQQLQQQQMHLQKFRDQQLQQQQLHQQHHLPHHQRQFQHLVPIHSQTQQKSVDPNSQQQRNPQQQQAHPQAQSAQPQASQPHQALGRVQQARAQPVQHIQPRNVQQASLGHSKTAYRAPPFVSEGEIASASPLRTVVEGQSGVSATAIAVANVVQQHSETPSSQNVKAKSKSSRKPSQRRPRSKVQQKILQPKNIQAASPTQSISHLQQTPQPMQIPHVLAPHAHGAQRQQLQGQQPQNVYISPQQVMHRSSPTQPQQSPSSMSQSQQDVQSRIMQQQLQIRRQQTHGSVINNTAKSFAQGTVPLAGSQLHVPSQSSRSVALGSQQQLSRQAALQNHGISGGLHVNQLLRQNIRTGLASVGKYDVAALQDLLSRTKDPKVYSVLRQQIEMLRGNGIPGQTSDSDTAPRAHVAHQRQSHIQPQHTSNLLPAGQPRPHQLPQKPASANAQGTSQAILFHQQQLARSQQIYKQRQEQYHPGARPGSSEQTRSGTSALPRTATYQQVSSKRAVGILNPHAGQSMASLPQHVQHQIQAQIQAQHIQARLQGHSNLASQRNAVLGAASGSQVASQNVTAVLPNKSASVEPRKPRRSPMSSKPVSSPAQLNGAMRNTTGSSPELQLAASIHQAGAAQYGAHQRHVTSQAHASRSLKRRDPGRAPGQEGSGGSQSTGSQSQSSIAKRSVDNKKIETERKRIAQEAELRELAEQKKRRLNIAPTNDLQCVLSPDYATPFSGQVNAWQRLVPFHVLLGREKNDVSQEDWNVALTKLEDQYRDWFGRIKKNYCAFVEREKEGIYEDFNKDIMIALDNDDGLAIETILLEDIYETARKEAAIAQRKAAEAALQQAAKLETQKYAQNLGASVPFNVSTVNHFARAETEHNRIPQGVGGYGGIHSGNYTNARDGNSADLSVAYTSMRPPAEQSQSAYVRAPEKVNAMSSDLYGRSLGTPNNTSRGLGTFPIRTPNTSVFGVQGGKLPVTDSETATQRFSHSRLQSHVRVPGRCIPENALEDQVNSHGVARQHHRFGQHRPAPAMAMLGRGSAMIDSDRWSSEKVFATDALVQADQRSGSSVPEAPRTTTLYGGGGDSVRRATPLSASQQTALVTKHSESLPSGKGHPDSLPSTGLSTCNDIFAGKAQPSGNGMYNSLTGEPTGKVGRCGPQQAGDTGVIGNAVDIGVHLPSSALPGLSTITQPLTHNASGAQNASGGLRNMMERPVPMAQLPKVAGLTRSGSGSRSSRGSRSASARSQAPTNTVALQRGEQRAQTPQPAPMLISQTLAKTSQEDGQAKEQGRSGTVVESGGKEEKERRGMGMGSLLNADGS